MVIYLGSLVQLLYREGHCIQISLACVGIACSIWVTLGLPPFMACVLFWSTLMFQVALTETVWGGPWVVSLPRSTLLRFRFSGTPERHRLRWVYVLCPSLIRAAHVTKCLVSTDSPGVVRLITSTVPVAQFPGCTTVSRICHVSPLVS